MYWPDYRVRSRRKPRWGSALLLGLILGIVAVALLDGWWRLLLPPAETGASFVAALPTPLSVREPRRATDLGAPPPVPTPVVAGVETVALAQPAPLFTLPDLVDPQVIYTLAEYRGRPIILNFWASWCVPCRREMPALQETAARYADQGLVLLGMNQTYIDDLAAARGFVEELGLTFPNTRDDGGEVGSDAYQVVGIPTTVFIDRQGQVAHIQIGEMSLEQITTYTERLLAGEPLQP